MAYTVAPVVVAIWSPLQRCSAKRFEIIKYTGSPCNAPLPQPMYHARQDLRGDVVTLDVRSRHGDTSDLHLHMPNLAGVETVSLHIAGEFHARLDGALVGSLAEPLHRPPLAARDAAGANSVHGG
jgi:hypothetical protein